MAALLDNQDANVKNSQLSATAIDNPSAAVSSTNDDDKWGKLVWPLQQKILWMDYMEDVVQIQLSLEQMEDARWQSLLSNVNNKQHPLRELQVYWNDMNKIIGSSNAAAESRFIELTKTLGSYTTSLKLTFPVSWNQKLAFALDALKDNRFIKHLSSVTEGLELDSAQALTRLLTNNQTLISLDLYFEVYIEAIDHFDRDVDCPVSTETLLELAHAFQSSSLQRLKIYDINNQGFEIIAKGLPKTRMHLDLVRNKIREESIPILHTYLTSNGSNLQELILDDQLATQYLQEYPSFTAKIMLDSSLEATLARKPRSLTIETRSKDDNDWSLLLTELNKKDTTVREINLSFENELKPSEVNYVQILLSTQCQLTSFIITNYNSSKSTGCEILPLLKDNNGIKQLQIPSVTAAFFPALVDALKTNNSITHLYINTYSYISDENISMLASCLKNLQSLVISNSQMSDAAFQTLVSCLSDSLYHLELDGSQITEQSLAVLLDFIATHKCLKKISLLQNGVSKKNSSGINVSNLLVQISELTNKKQCIFTFMMDENMSNVTENVTDNILSLNPSRLRGHHLGRLYDEMKKKPDLVLLLYISDSKYISPIGCRHLANILSSTIHIVSLGLVGDDLDEEERRNVLDGLQKNKTLTDFKFWNKLNNQDMESIARFIQNNPALEKVRLYKCDIGDDAITPLIKALPKSHLEDLDLSDNALGDASCASLLTSIPFTLKKLALSSNKMTEASLETILNFLATNRTLNTLELRYNPIFENKDDQENVYRQQIIEAAKQNGICQVTEE